MNRHVSWRLASRPADAPWERCFSRVEAALPEPAPGQARVRTLLFSVDPTHRIWMSDVDQYLPPLAIGEVFRGSAIGVVEKSELPDVPVGTVVQGFWGWQSHVLLDVRGLRHRVPNDPAIPQTAWLSVLGGTGLTAWFGIEDVVRPSPGQTVVVSAAAGAVGSIAGQLARRRGARVVGIAGGAEKCRWLVETCGFDAAIDRRGEDVGEALDRHCPDGIDAGFENVGGPLLDAVLARCNVGARIAVCGLIADYPGLEGAGGPRLFRNVLMKRLTLQGFIVLDYAPRFGEALAALSPLVRDGALAWQDDVTDGFDRAPDVLRGLFEGRNRGKAMVRV